VEITRRGFLAASLGGIVLAAARTFPFRVFSFPSGIVVPGKTLVLATSRLPCPYLKDNFFVVDELFLRRFEKAFGRLPEYVEVSS
jgi:hypothetical protein